MTLGPAWLQRVSDLIPFRYSVDTARSAFAGTFVASTLLWGIGWALVLFAAAIWWGTRVFRRENA